MNFSLSRVVCFFVETVLFSLDLCVEEDSSRVIFELIFLNGGVYVVCRFCRKTMTMLCAHSGDNFLDGRAFCTFHRVFCVYKCVLAFDVSTVENRTNLLVFCGYLSIFYFSFSKRLRGQVLVFFVARFRVEHA